MCKLSLTVLTLLLVCGWGHGEQETREPWAAKPHEQWPQIVLTSVASFKGHTPLHGASGFIIRSDSGSLVGVMTVWFKPRMKGDLWTEAGGEDAAGALEILRRSN